MTVRVATRVKAFAEKKLERFRAIARDLDWGLTIFVVGKP